MELQDLQTEVVRYTFDATGKPVRVVVPYVQTSPDAEGAVQLPHTGTEAWWVPSVPDVPEDERLGADEYDDAITQWQRARAAEVEAQRRRDAEVVERAATERAKAREELAALGLSPETVDVVLGGGLS